MDSSQINVLLKTLEKRANSAFSFPADVYALTEIKNELLEVKTEFRFHFKTFAKEFNERLFSSGIGLPGESLRSYTKDTIEKVSVNKPILPQSSDFKETFKSFVQCLQHELPTLKNYCFITLNTDNSDNYSLIILHDKDYFVNPIKNCIKSHPSDVNISTVEDFQNNLRANNVDYKNYICLILLKSKMNVPEELENCRNDLKNILIFFDSSESISIIDTDLNSDFYVKQTLIEGEFLDEIEYLTSAFLTNTALHHEEEKIIKKLFKNHACPLLEYKLLKSGNSGANVIEIRPKKNFKTQLAKRYVAKYRRLSEPLKLKTEVRNFNNWIGAYQGFSEYTCDYETTSTHEGILYSYAKSDFEETSFPFSSIIDESKNQFHNQASNTIIELFSIEVFELWNSNINSITKTVRETYKDFIKPGVKVEIEKILDYSSMEVEKEALIKNYEKILNYVLTTKEKVCHGDLHTDNFFKDNKGVYLIDFGFTEELPATIDHAFLECSIKFNHIPRYIDVDTLIKFERELLNDDTFSASYRFRHASRRDLSYFSDIIKQIRVNSSRLLSRSDKLEYFVSLFIITFKLIEYSDLNQLYALKSATILAEKIIQEM